jgi:predicted regulator of Ras-like GTPase activity (Roadblock/LC7/MglB family)
MDAAQALADLTEISAQIEGAVLAGEDGSVIASTFNREERGAELAGAARELVEAAGEPRGEGKELVQLQAATPRGSVFVVRDGRHIVAALTGAKPTVGLVFYDLKTCLRMLEREEGKAGRAEAPAPPEPEEAAETAAKAEKAAATKPRVGKAATSPRKTTAKKKDEGGDESA